jgi:hypothetical protein
MTIHQKDTEYLEQRQYIPKSSVAWVRKRTISTERPPLVGEVSALLRIVGATWSAWRIPTAIFSDL